MERGLSIIEQAPLDGYKAPPSPLSFKHWLVVLWQIILLKNHLCLGLSIVGYLIPVWILAIVYVYIRITFVGDFRSER